MAYKQAKVYTDGSHFIAIPHTTHKTRKRITPPEEQIVVPVPLPATESAPDGKDEAVQTRTLTRKHYFDELYQDSAGLSKTERKEKIVEKIKPYIKEGEDAELFVEENIARKRRNMSVRRVRLMRKVNLQKFNYFCTFTYDDKLHTEESFRRKLRTCFRHLVERKGWKYVGVWERAPKTGRLHFHGLFYIPEGAMQGELVKVGDFSTKTHKWQITYQNEYFKCRFGRNDFHPLGEYGDKYNAVEYMIKYMEKTGEKIVYSKGLPQFIISDILDEDVICTYGQEDKKLLLFDDFTLIEDGCVIGKANEENIAKMPKSN